MIPVLILAAGQSRRMCGADKLMQDIDGKSLLRRQIEISAPLGPVFVALPPSPHPRSAALNGTNATALALTESSEGLGGTLRGAVPKLPHGPFMLLLGDLVSLTAHDLRSVYHAMHAHPDHLIWRGATPDGQGGHPIIFHESLASAFEKLSGEAGGETLVKSLILQTYLHRFPDNRARDDLDTPEDWDAWRQMKR